jgi:DNA-binding response OmpR family regulator
MASGDINLKAANVLLFDTNSAGMSILAQMLGGFGAKTITKAESVKQAKDHVRANGFDLVVCDAAGPEGEDGYDFVHWLRRCGAENAFTSVIVTSAHTSLRAVARARDCGASFIVAKPLAPRVLLKRILWVAHENRPFISCDAYWGPDRRFRNDGPPDATEGRRSTDLSAKVGEATLPNMSQDEIDALMMPKRVVL